MATPRRLFGRAIEIASLESNVGLVYSVLVLCVGSDSAAAGPFASSGLTASLAAAVESRAFCEASPLGPPCEARMCVAAAGCVFRGVGSASSRARLNGLAAVRPSGSRNLAYLSRGQGMLRVRDLSRGVPCADRHLCPTNPTIRPFQKALQRRRQSHANWAHRMTLVAPLVAAPAAIGLARLACDCWIRPHARLR